MAREVLGWEPEWWVQGDEGVRLIVVSSHFQEALGLLVCPGDLTVDLASCDARPAQQVIPVWLAVWRRLVASRRLEA